jgi:ribosomal protein S18 acetylase RimI-like enzyme
MNLGEGVASGMEVFTDPTEEQIAEVECGLDEYNAGLASVRSTTSVRAVFVDSGAVVAGIVGAAYWGKLHVRMLWVHPEYRSNGLGSRLMCWAEELRCVSVMVDTMSFQAPDFLRQVGIPPIRAI